MALLRLPLPFMRHDGASAVTYSRRNSVTTIVDTIFGYKKKESLQLQRFLQMVGPAGFEPATP